MVYDYKEKLGVQGEKCIATGGAQGPSRGMAEGLLENGAEVALTDLQKERLEQAVEEYCGKGYRAHGVTDDLSKRTELDQMLDETVKLLGERLDVMISTAGIQGHHEPWEFPEEMWNPVVNADLNHVWSMCQRTIQAMRNKDIIGKIVNTGSMNSFFGGTTVPAYPAIKGAVTQLSKGIASDYADHNIYCNVIAPGYMDVEMYASMSQEHKNECTERITTGRWGRPEDLRGSVLFLAFSISNYLNGAVIPADGRFLVESQEADQVNLRVYNK